MNENEPTGSLVSFKLSKSNVPTKIDEISSLGADPPYVAAFGKEGKDVLIVNVSPSIYLNLIIKLTIFAYDSITEGTPDSYPPNQAH